MPRAKKTMRVGLRALKRKIEGQGIAALDLRTGGGRALMAWRTELISALGGEEQITPQLLTLVEQVTRLKLFLDHVDCFLLSLHSLVNKRNKKMVPVMRERLALASELRATLTLLGLKKIPKAVSRIPPERMKEILAVADEQKPVEEKDEQRPESV